MWDINELDVARERHRDLIKQAERERLILFLLENQPRRKQTYFQRKRQQISDWWRRTRFQFKLKPAKYRASLSH